LKLFAVIALLVCMVVPALANPFVAGGSDSWATLEGDLEDVTTSLAGMQTTITGAIKAILPMLIGIFVVFLVIKLAPRMVKAFAK